MTTTDVPTSVSSPPYGSYVGYCVGDPHRQGIELLGVTGGGSNASCDI